MTHSDPLYNLLFSGLNFGFYASRYGAFILPWQTLGPSSAEGGFSC